MLECPRCKSTHIRKNGHRGDKQNNRCVDCGRQFIEQPKSHRGYSDDVRNLCLKMYVNGMGFRGIARVTDIHHTTIINWVKQVGGQLPDAHVPQEIPGVGELDEIQTFVGSKKNKLWIWTAVDHFKPGLLGWVVGYRRCLAPSSPYGDWSVSGSASFTSPMDTRFILMSARLT